MRAPDAEGGHTRDPASADGPPPASLPPPAIGTGSGSDPFLAAGRRRAAASSHGSPISRASRRRRRAETVEAYAFLAPALLLLLAFSIVPIFFTGYISLFRWRIRRGDFVGLANYLLAFGSWGYLALLAAGIVLAYLGFRLLRRLGEEGRATAARTARSRAARRLPGETAAARRALRTLAGAALSAAGIALAVVGLAEMARTGDADLLTSLRVTVWYSLGSVPVQLALGLALALVLNRKFRGRQTYRALFIIPFIVPTVAAAAVFERIFSLRPEALANQVAGLVHLGPLQWLYEPRGLFQLLFGVAARESAGSLGIVPARAGLFAAVLAYLRSWAVGPSLALVSVALFNWWVFVGYYALIFLNGLSQIPRQIYDAAAVDGANRFTLFRKIILPMVSPSTYFLTLIGIVGTFKAFNHIYIMRTAAAQGTIDPMSVYIFFTFYREARFGYASAVAILLFLIVLALTLLQRRLMEHRIFFGEEG